MAMAIPNPVRVIVVYCPPPSTCSHNDLTHELFFTEFKSFLEQLNNDTGHIIISGDDDNINSKKLLIE